MAIRYFSHPSAEVNKNSELPDEVIDGKSALSLLTGKNKWKVAKEAYFFLLPA